MKSIWAHVLVKNEARWLWFAVTSVIGYVDKVLLWDTGSTDDTINLIEELKKKYPTKIDFKEVGEVTPGGYTKISQKMLDETTADWFIIVDGDEVWWDESIRKVVEGIRGVDDLEMIISPVVNCVGDIFHYQEEAAGNYEIDEHKGHINIKAVNRRIPGLHFEKPHGMRGLYDSAGKVIQSRSKSKRIFIDSPLMHFTNLPRSTNDKYDLLVPKRAAKLKYEIGIPFQNDYFYPEVFFRERPGFVESPWKIMKAPFKFRAYLETPFRKIKRRIWNKTVGY